MYAALDVSRDNQDEFPPSIPSFSLPIACFHRWAWADGDSRPEDLLYNVNKREEAST